MDSLPTAGRRAILPALCLVTAGAAAFPGAEPAGVDGLPEFECRDLSLLPESSAVDYGEIQSEIFDSQFTNCSGCHGAVGGLGGLGLAASVSYEELVCAPTSTNTPGAGAGYRVVPFAPEESWLFLRINCFSQDDPGFRMPLGGSVVFTERQRQLFDWIAQGARRSLDLPFGSSFESELCPELPGSTAR